MRKLLIVTGLFFGFATPTFAQVEITNSKCMNEIKTIRTAMMAYDKGSQALKDDALDTGNYIITLGTSLIAQSNRRVGGVGYNVRKSGQNAVANTNTFWSRLETAKEQLDQAVFDLAVCANN